MAIRHALSLFKPELLQTSHGRSPSRSPNQYLWEINLPELFAVFGQLFPYTGIDRGNL